MTPLQQAIEESNRHRRERDAAQAVLAQQRPIVEAARAFARAKPGEERELAEKRLRDAVLASDER